MSPLGNNPTNPVSTVLGLAAVASIAAGVASCSKRPPEPAETQAQPASQPASVAGSGKQTSPSTPVESEPFDFQLGPLPGGVPFEGTIKVEASTDAKTHGPERTTFAVKGRRVRWNLPTTNDSPSAAAYRIYDGEAHRFYTVVPERKTVFLADEAALEANAGRGRSYTLTPDAREPRGVVQAHPCDRMQTHDDQAQYSVCAAKGLAALPFHLLGEGITALAPFGKALEEQGLFPLAVTAQRAGSGPDDAGPPLGSLVVLDMTRGAVPEMAFAYPRPYARVSAPTLDPRQLLR